MRLLVFVTILTAVAAGTITFHGAVQAQNADLDRLRLQSLQQQNMQAQEQHNALRRGDADNAQTQSDQFRLRTEDNLRVTRPQPPEITGAGRIETDAEAMRRLQDEQLSQSNARLRAIEPAAR